MIFLPYEKPGNPFWEELTPHIPYHCTYGHWTRVPDNTRVVHIHWPEALFDWKPPTAASLDSFETEIKRWHRKYKIVYTRHNTQPHGASSDNYTRLYALVIQYAHAVVHLGALSKKTHPVVSPSLEKRTHTVIPHHLYATYPNDVLRQEARRILNIPMSKKVIMVFGIVRDQVEANFILSVFEKLKTDHRFLLIPTFDFNQKSLLPGRVTAFVNQQKRNKLNKSNYFLLENIIVPSGNVQHYFNAADIVFIPRMKGLNTGVLPLGLSFNCKVVCPQIGNNSELIEQSGSFGYDVGNITSAVAAIEKALDQSEYRVPAEVISSRSPAVVAAQYSALYNQLMADDG